MDAAFRAFVAEQENWQGGPFFEVGAWFDASVEHERPWAALWDDAAISGPFSDHQLVETVEPAVAEERRGLLTLPDGRGMGFRARLRSHREDRGFSLWLWFPYGMVARVASRHWYTLPPSPEMVVVHQASVAFLKRLRRAVPFRFASVADEGAGHWPSAHNTTAIPRGAIIVEREFAPHLPEFGIGRAAIL